MSERAITRRSLLAAGAGALAVGALRPAGALAALDALAGRRPRLGERRLGALAPGSIRTLLLERSADLVGVQWSGPAQPGLQLRFRAAGGGWGAWVSAAGHGHGPDLPRTGGERVGEPLWTGGTRELQLRTSRALGAVVVHLVDVSAGIGARRLAALAGRSASAAALALASPHLAAGGGQPPIIARRAWAGRAAPPRVAPEYGAVRMAFVHHTENPNGYSAGEVPAMLRAIYAFHRYVNGWNDIGYNFVVDLYGRVFEARAGGIDEPVVGAHAGGYNLASTGVAVLGSFMSAPVSPAARAALERLLAWKVSLHGVPSVGRVTVKVNPGGASYSRFPANALVSLPRIAGHRDGDSTDCPGDVLYGTLPSIRSRVLRLAPRPSRLTLALAPAPVPAPGPAPPATPPPGSPPASSAPATPSQPVAAARGLTGTLTFLDGTPIAGATVLVQVRTVSARGESVLERTVAEALTDAAGGFSAPGSYLPASRGGTSLRALFIGVAGAAGATISEPLRVAVQAPLSPSPVPAPTPPAAAPPAS
jgi:hypothetical protein